MSKANQCTRAEVSANFPAASFMRLDYGHASQHVDVAIIGVPWDGGTGGHTGSRLGPGEIRKVSGRLRRFNPSIEASPFDLCSVADFGDVPVDPFDRVESLKTIERFYAHLASFDVMPLTVGGDHLVTLPILRAIARSRPLGMMHFDAHLDVADQSADEGERYTSGTPFRRAIEEGLLDPKRIVQVGVRSTIRTPEMVQWAQDEGIRTVTMDEFQHNGVDSTIQEARRILSDGPTYLSLDIDAIDPAFAPGTGVPVVGGLSTREVQRLLRGLSGLDLVGADVVEISPPYDINDMTALVGASLAFDMLCLLAEVSARRAAA